MEKYIPFGPHSTGVHHGGVDESHFPQQNTPIKHNPNHSPYWRDTLAKKENSPFTLLADPVHPNRAKEIVKDKDIQEFIDDVHSIKRNFEEMGISFDQAYRQSVRDSFDLAAFCQQVNTKLAEAQRSEMKQLNQERLERIQETLKRVQTSRVWRHFANIAAGVAGVVGLLSGPLAAAVAIPLIITMIGNTVDNALDNRGKKALGKLFTDGSEASKEKFANYFGMGLAVVQLVLSCGLTLAAPTQAGGNLLARMGQNASQTIGIGSQSLASAATIGKGVNDYRLSCSRADQAQLELASSQSKEFLDNLMAIVKRLAQQRSELASMAKEHADLIRSMSRMQQI